MHTEHRKRTMTLTLLFHILKYRLFCLLRIRLYFFISLLDRLKIFTFILGVENGLKLRLNVEQYEYMPGPHDAAGIKILIHDRLEIPRVYALGQAVSTGSNVFAGVQLLKVKIYFKVDNLTTTCLLFIPKICFHLAIYFLYIFLKLRKISI